MTTSRKPNDDQYEVAIVVRHLVRLRHHHGRSAVAEAVQAAARLDWRFCQSCGSEESHEGDLCTGCGRNTNRRCLAAKRERIRSIVLTRR